VPNHADEAVDAARFPLFEVRIAHRRHFVASGPEDDPVRAVDLRDDDLLAIFIPVGAEEEPDCYADGYENGNGQNGQAQPLARS
jgi:hypothetical protein